MLSITAGWVHAYDEMLSISTAMPGYAVRAILQSRMVHKCCKTLYLHQCNNAFGAHIVKAALGQQQC